MGKQVYYAKLQAFENRIRAAAGAVSGDWPKNIAARMRFISLRWEARYVETDQGIARRQAMYDLLFYESLFACNKGKTEHLICSVSCGSVAWLSGFRRVM